MESRKKLDMDGETYRETQEPARDRAFQSRMEWLKTLYDFYKHFMTIAFTSIAAVLAAAAFLGDTFKKTSGVDTPPIPTALLVVLAVVFAIVAIVAFLITGHASLQGMTLARQHILGLPKVKNDEGFEKLRKEKLRKSESHTSKWDREWDRDNVWKWVSQSYAIGSLALGLFVVTSILSRI
jgi:hypothetical protein